ncbi:hypothetical protein RJE46_24615 (plasmid) [Cedecea neteri]|uniref:hypothetical protein n=1 Tax=Cedecea neteri TaxID=158822 RepID=UPI002892C1D9|nr:hypothetical protein [Cedecea neteri]WNJ82260.1 hypothetical protein RJE46_24615 [Cedecea neteri]
MNHISEASIVTPVMPSVQSSGIEMMPRRKQGRVNHADTPAQEISPRLRSRGRHILHCSKKGRSVRVPAMRGSEWGDFLRALEVSRGIN